MYLKIITAYKYWLDTCTYTSFILFGEIERRKIKLQIQFGILVSGIIDPVVLIISKTFNLDHANVSITFC